MTISFISYGIDVVQDADLNSSTGTGNDGAGQITLNGGTQIFGYGQIVQVFVDDLSPDGEVLPTSLILSIKVYDSVADYQAGTVLYDYTPDVPGGSTPVQDSLTGMGDTYLYLDVSNFISADAGAPALTTLFIAPGTDANDNYGSLTIDRDTDVDFDGDGTIAAGTIEEGNTWFNTGYATQVYGPISDGIVTGTAVGDVMELGYVDPSDGDVITTGNDQIEGSYGNDTIDGDAGNDGVFGGEGDDQITGGTGDDWVVAEGGNDTITLADGFGNDTIIGGETGETTGDRLDASAVTGNLSVDLSGTDPEAGTVSDGVFTASFSQIETVALGGGNDTVILGDGGGGRYVDTFAGPTDNGDGTFSGIDVLDVSGLTNDQGVPVTTDDVSVLDDGNGNAVLSFPNGESLTLMGVNPTGIAPTAALVAIGIPAGAAAGSDFIVSGTDAGELIDFWYNGDPDGDMVDAGDAADGSDNDHIQAGGGDDTVWGGFGDDLIEGGAGNDTFYGGDGDDTVYGDDGADLIYGDDGNDVAFGGAGNDSFLGLDGDDYLEGGDGDDKIEGDQGNDTLIGGAGNDWMRGSYGEDYLEGGEGDDFLWSGYNDDTIVMHDNFGNDTIEMEGQAETYGDILDFSRVTSDLVVDMSTDVQGTGSVSDGVSTAIYESVEHLILGEGTNTVLLGHISGYDTIEGFTGPTDNGDGTYTGHDQVNVDDMQDFAGGTIDTSDVTVSDDGTGNAVLSFPNGETLTLVGVAPSEVASPAQLNAIGIPLPPSVPDGVVEGTAGDDLIDTAYTGDPEGDMVDGPDGENDAIEAGDGNDTVLAGAGDDAVYGGAGDDLLNGGDGADQLYGNDGNDSFDMGAGDSALGDGGDDTFNVRGMGGGHTVVDGGETGEVLGDTLNITGPATIAYDPANGENGHVEWQDGTTLDFSNIENITYVPCFTPASLIKTARGEVPAGLLQCGDRVLTRDNGFQEIAWIGQRALTRPELERAPKLRPILIRKGALGPNQPERDLFVSPQHRMLINTREAALWFGQEEAFAPAIALTGLPGIRQVQAPGVTYVHFMTDRHQVVMGDGAWSESFQPGDLTLSDMDHAQREELFALFPELAQGQTSQVYPAARVTLTAHEARLLAR